jgi:PIN domain nuclease of toxin-antitoxin system
VRLLLDTHAVLWWFTGASALSHSAREALQDDANEIFVSAVSMMEVTTKHRIGKLPEADVVSAWFLEMVEHQGFVGLPITLVHGALAGSLSMAHRDPFDRLLIAQAITETMVLVSNERLFDQTGVERLW